jgi:DNA-directed RNA polymerase II subunit RPB1
MVDTEIYSYEDRVRQIDHVDFTIFGNEEIKKISALGRDNPGIEIPDLYENLEPKRGGLIDPRLGTTDNHIDCATCGLNNTYCVGHFGHIDLAEPIFHIGFLAYVKKILSCICLRCSKLLVYKNEEEIEDMLKNKSEKARMNEIRNLVKNVTTCQKKYYGCGNQVSKIKLEIKKNTGAINIISETDLSGLADEAGAGEDGKKKNRQILTPDIVYDILKGISDVDCRIMGMDPEKSRPEMMIQKVFPVPPVQMRPSARADFMAASTLEDDLTHKLADIIKANIRIRKHKETMNENTAKYASDHIHLLQFHGVTYLNNETISLPRSEQKGKATKSLESRLKGKEGRIRSNLMGKTCLLTTGKCC